MTPYPWPETMEQYCSYVGEIITLDNWGTRPKYFGDAFVIKYDETIRGPNFLSRQSTTEIELWETLDDNDRRHFVKLLDYSLEEGWVAQERIEIVQKTPTREQRTVIEGLKKKFGLSDILGIVMANWTLLEDGTPVIYDWGTIDKSLSGETVDAQP